MTARSKTLAQRIGDMIAGQPDVASALANFPAPIQECWLWQGNTTKVVYIQGTTKPVVRALMEIGCREPWPDWWIPARLPTCNNKLCVNPTHFEPKPYNQNRYGEVGPLPMRLMKPDACQLDDIRTLMEEWDYPTRTAFLAKCDENHFEFSEAAIDEAFSSAPNNSRNK